MKTKITVLGKEESKSILGGPKMTLIDATSGEVVCIRQGFTVYC